MRITPTSGAKYFVDTFLQPLRTKLSNILREVGLHCFKAWTFGYSLVHTLLVTSTWNDQAASSCFGKAVKLSLMVLWLRQASSIIPIFWPSYLLASLNLLHSRADSCVCWQRCAETSQSSFQGNLCDSQYAIRTTGDSVLIWRRGLSCQGSCLWLVDDGRWHGKTDCQTLPILSVACYSVLSLLPLHSSTLLSRCLTADPDAWPRAILAGWPCRESAHSSYRLIDRKNNGGTVCARSPHLKTPKLSCLPNDVNYHQIETKMAFRFTSGGVYDDLRLKWLNEHCSLSKDEKKRHFRGAIEHFRHT